MVESPDRAIEFAMENVAVEKVSSRSLRYSPVKFHSQFILGSFAKLRKAAISFVMPVRMEQLDSY